MLRRSNLSLFISSDFGLYCLPVYLNVSSKLLELFIRFLSLVHLKETFSVSNYRINMSLVVNCDFKSSVPLVEFNVEFYCSVVKSRGQKDLLSFGNLLLVNR